jgi:acetylornithine/N-succinyldiaminopimelate aminotransferase
MSDHRLRNLFFSHVAQTSDAPLALEITHAEGVYLYSGERQYIDCISGIAVSNVGHANAAVNAAIKKQLDKHLHLMVYGEMIQGSQVELANRLQQHLPPQLRSVYFVNSGSEAIEGAMKLAKRVTGRSHFVAQFLAYHGSTQGALSLMSDTYFSGPYHPLLPGISFIEKNDIAALDTLITKETAAVFIEPVMGEKGYEVCSPEYLRAVRKKCDETGALLVFDEIQSGYGRTGKLFAFEHDDVVPDILVLAKGFGGGMPLGAFISSKTLLDHFMDNPVLGHITTFGGHPLSCAASLAALDFIFDRHLMEQVSEKEALFRRLLTHPLVKEISGRGLLLAIDLKDKDFCRKVIDDCVRDGLLIDWFLYAEHKIRLAPPLIIENQHIEQICGIIIENIQKNEATFFGSNV